MRSVLATLPVALALVGCATMSKDECLTADWYQVGYEDGALGYADTRISQHRQACAEYGITTDLRAYQDGHEEGIIRFCTPRNGFVQGRNGYNYTGICPPSLEHGFLDGYDAGREIYSARLVISELNAEQDSNENKVEALQDKISSTEQTLFSVETPAEEKRTLYESIGRMKEQLGALEQRNKELIVELAKAQAQLRILEDRYAYF